ncbi:PHD finger protein ing2-like [Trifolium pratense]|uniref:PHD finger protein ing2-like n=1 Tax=Trifolium pratense TaxID=57577 RepID=A0A2K3MYF6_TRIPR|nr:PHD finger protein ing2-like [Trifolium pratense]PNX95838.1 PHD finger protein ing2-like [Trifolium pratense]
MLEVHNLVFPDLYKETCNALERRPKAKREYCAEFREGKIPQDEPAILPPLPIVPKPEKRRHAYGTPQSKRLDYRERDWDRDFELMPPPGSHKKDYLTPMDIDQPIDPNEPTYCVCHQVSFGDMIACDNENVILILTEFYYVILDSAEELQASQIDKFLLKRKKMMKVASLTDREISSETEEDERFLYFQQAIVDKPTRLSTRLITIFPVMPDRSKKELEVIFCDFLEEPIFKPDIESWPMMAESRLSSEPASLT